MLLLLFLYYARWHHTVQLKTVEYKTSAKSTSQQHYT